MTTLSVRPGVDEALERSWAEIAGPGDWWSADDRVEIARVARAAFEGESKTSEALRTDAIEAIELLATTPALTTEAWVGSRIEPLGVGRYIELTGIVARVVAADTHDRLIGRDVHPIPSANGGGPTGAPLAERARHKKTWAPVVVASAPHSLGAVPSAEAAMTDLCVELYLDPVHILDASFTQRAFDKTQIELMATVTSIVNECFY